MPSVTHDGRSFMLDSRRIWLVSGQIPYARLPRELWAERIHAAKLAGFNTIETPVFWNRHEARPGKFDFSGDNDLKHFVTLIGRAGMHCMLGIGPYIGGEWDMGGLPSWLLETPNVTLRANNQPFLEACSRYITAVADQVKGLQVTSPNVGGPIVLVECESDWTCGHDGMAAGYIGELIRYIREAGLNVPVINSNNLWQGVEGQIDGWSGTRELLSTMRQLASVRPNQPRVVVDFTLGNPAFWDQPAIAPASPSLTQRRLAEVLAGGGQYNVRPLTGGWNPGFWGGRAARTDFSFAAAEFGTDALISASGTPNAAHGLVRRLNCFAARFSRVFANLDPSYHPINIDPAPLEHAGEAKPAKSGRSQQELAVVQAKGSQGSVLFVFADERSERSGHRETRLLLPDGTSMPVTVGEQSVVWCLIDAHLSPRVHLDYCNLCAFGAVGQVFVCFGPVGARGMVSVNGSPLEVTVPGGKNPLTIEHEGLTVVVASEEQIDSVYVTDDAALLGVAGITPEGLPILPVGSKTYTRAGTDGSVRQISVESGRHAPHHGAALPLSHWACAPADEHRLGTSPRYASIAGPAEMGALGCPFGYGWYRFTVKADAARKVRLGFPSSGDRLSMYVNGNSIGVVGFGPAAADTITLPLVKGSNQVVILADNLGRFAEGMHLADRKGVWGEAFEVAPLKLPPPKVITADPEEILKPKTPIWEVSEGDTSSPERLTWTITHKRRTPIIMRLLNPIPAGLLMLNGKVIHIIDSSGPHFVVLQPDALAKGANLLQLTLHSSTNAGEILANFGKSVEFMEGTASFTAKAEAAFAKWEPPIATAFAPVKVPAKGKGPAWWKATFTPPEVDTPIAFDATGLSKGQLYVNGRNVSRYFVSADAKTVPPQHLYLIPRPMLRAKQPNELLFFDEQGAAPVKCKMVYV